MDIVTLGELLIDMFPAKVGQRLGEVEAFTPKPGGAPANVAVAARRLGAQTAFIGKVGQDPFGDSLKRVLDDEGVDTRGLRFDEHARTTMAVIAMPDANSAEFFFYRNPGADYLLRVNELDIGLLENTKAFHFGSLSLTNEPARSATFEAARIAREAGALVSYDVNYRPSLWKEPGQALEVARKILPKVDLLKVNEVEVALLAERETIDPADITAVEQAARDLLGKGPQLVIVTLGKDGSYFQTETSGEYIPAYQVDTIDAIGCGDAFVAGLLSRLVQGSDWRANLDGDYLTQALRYANAVGALTSLKRGTIPAMPTAKEVDGFLEGFSTI
jgi:fructokinase